MDFSYSIVRDGDKKVKLFLKGDIGVNLNALQELKEVMDELTLKPGVELAVDFSEVSFISSNGISIIVRGFKRTTQAKGEFILMNLNPQIFSTFEILGLTDMIPVKYSETEKCEEAFSIAANDSKKSCPHCGRIIEVNAIRCPYCYNLIED